MPRRARTTIIVGYEWTNAVQRETSPKQRTSAGTILISISFVNRSEISLIRFTIESWPNIFQDNVAGNLHSVECKRIKPSGVRGICYAHQIEYEEYCEYDIVSIADKV